MIQHWITELTSLLEPYTVLDYADLFSITFRNDKVQEFGTRWDENLLSMTKIQWLRVAGDKVALNDKRNLLSVESKRAVFERRPM